MICAANNAWLQFSEEICRNFLKLYYNYLDNLPTKQILCISDLMFQLLNCPPLWEHGLQKQQQKSTFFYFI